MKTGITILARMGSSRLPGKVLKKICGKTILEHMIYRMKKVKGADIVIVATSHNQKDNQIERLCRLLDTPFFRGDEDNVLRRCIETNEAFQLDTAVIIGADCPLADWEVIDDMLRVFFGYFGRGVA